MQRMRRVEVNIRGLFISITDSYEYDRFKKGNMARMANLYQNTKPSGGTQAYCTLHSRVGSQVFTWHSVTFPGAALARLSLRALHNDDRDAMSDN